MFSYPLLLKFPISLSNLRQVVCQMLNALTSLFYNLSSILGIAQPFLGVLKENLGSIVIVLVYWHTTAVFSHLLNYSHKHIVVLILKRHKHLGIRLLLEEKQRSLDANLRKECLYRKVNTGKELEMPQNPQAHTLGVGIAKNAIGQYYAHPASWLEEIIASLDEEHFG